MLEWLTVYLTLLNILIIYTRIYLESSQLILLHNFNKNTILILTRISCYPQPHV